VLVVRLADELPSSIAGSPAFNLPVHYGELFLIGSSTADEPQDSEPAAACWDLLDGAGRGDLSIAGLQHQFLLVVTGQSTSGRSWIAPSWPSVLVFFSFWPSETVANKSSIFQPVL
jgi:hypothetical protein